MFDGFTDEQIRRLGTPPYESLVVMEGKKSHRIVVNGDGTASYVREFWPCRKCGIDHTQYACPTDLECFNLSDMD